MQADVVFRTIHQNERDQLLTLFHHLNPNDFPLSEQSVVDDIWSQMMTNPVIDIFVAETDGQLVATCTLILVPNLTRGGRPYAFIENVVTHADYRQRGIGTGLLKHILDHCWERDCYKVMLLTGRHDEATHRFYEKAGFSKDTKTGFTAYRLDH